MHSTRATHDVLSVHLTFGFCRCDLSWQERDFLPIRVMQQGVEAVVMIAATILVL